MHEKTDEKHLAFVTSCSENSDSSVIVVILLRFIIFNPLWRSGHFLIPDQFVNIMSES